ncbi:hypothetical protein A3860_36435 [Niastella vici]|uniref:Peptidase C14 caspase domain-containing protein n=1 Tax=Niastella vici TaxID=1703345 RepID=A0A1V9FMU2_9BACT|nr:caspase family protein [Niastella vici]OQP59660.1 hypothetical protein A3860_36435 [Niastella vici]
MYKDYALIIGINDYTREDSDLPQLHGAIKDAEGFEEWFVKDSGNDDANGIEKHFESVYSKCDPLTPVYDVIEKALGKLLKKAEEEPALNRRLYFYFAGHGIGLDYDTTNNALCLADWSEKKRGNALSSKDYHNTFIKLGLFRQVIILLDCCREIKVNVYPRPPEETPMAGSGPHQAEVFWGYATKFNNLAHEIDTENGDKRGAFTYVLMNGLRGGAANEDGIIDSVNLKKYLDRYVPVAANRDKLSQKPEINNGLTEPESIFAKVDPGLVPCAIQFQSHRTGPVLLVDGLGKTIEKIVDAGGKKITIDLKKGKYLLKDELNHEVHPINIESFRFPINPIAINF